jgi:DnaJ-class molecular chaperone
VRIKPNPGVTLEGNDIKTEVEVPLYTAVLGGETVVKTLTGRVALMIPSQTQNGRVFRLRGQGWPTAIGSSERGDLLARVSITLPASLSERELRLFEQLRELRVPATASSVT